MSGTSGWPCTPRRACARRPTVGRSSSPATRGPPSGHRLRRASASAASADIACPAFRSSRLSSRSRRKVCAPSFPSPESHAVRPLAPRSGPRRPAGLEPPTSRWRPSIATHAGPYLCRPRDGDAVDRDRRTDPAGGAGSATREPGPLTPLLPPRGRRRRCAGSSRALSSRPNRVIPGDPTDRPRVAGAARRSWRARLRSLRSRRARHPTARHADRPG